MVGHPANSRLKISQKGIDLIKHFEGWYAKAYKDPVGVWTIGWGTTGREAVPGRTITKEQGEAFLRADLEDESQAVRDLVKVPLSQHQFDALVSFTYNCGRGNLERSTALKMLNRENYDAVPSLLARYNKARDRRTGEWKTLRGLTRRRAAEGALFLTEAVEPHNFPVPETEEKGESGVVPDAIEKQKFDWNIFSGTDTFKTLTMQIMGIATTVTAVITQLEKNPLVAVGVGITIVGLAAAAYIKFRDSQEGR